MLRTNFFLTARNEEKELAHQDCIVIYIMMAKYRTNSNLTMANHLYLSPTILHFNLTLTGFNLMTTHPTLKKLFFSPY